MRPNFFQFLEDTEFVLSQGLHLLFPCLKMFLPSSSSSPGPLSFKASSKCHFLRQPTGTHLSFPAPLCPPCCCLPKPIFLHSSGSPSGVTLLPDPQTSVKVWKHLGCHNLGKGLPVGRDQKWCYNAQDSPPQETGTCPNANKSEVGKPCLEQLPQFAITYLFAWLLV